MACLLAATSVQVGVAAQLNDPDWPCIQPQVPRLSVGQMWPGPLPPEDAPAADPAMVALARALAPRRISVEDIATTAADAMQGMPSESRPDWLAQLFAAILERINAERGEVIAGIGRYAARQRALSGWIDAMEADLVALEAAPEAERDMDRIEELRDGLAWETRIFKDRAQSLTYVCEAPVLLEQRAFAIGRALAGLM